MDQLMIGSLSRRLRRRSPCTPESAPRADQGRGGFTMLEALISVAILAVGLLGMTAGQLAASKLAGTSRSRTEAAYIAQQRMEAFHSMPASAVKALGSGADANPIHTPAETYNRSWTIAPDSPEAGVLTITVDVDWVDQNGRDRTLTLQTYKQDF